MHINHWMVLNSQIYNKLTPHAYRHTLSTQVIVIILLFHFLLSKEYFFPLRAVKDQKQQY